MKILFIAPSPPNLMSRIRSYNLISAFLSLGHEVTIVSLYSKDGENVDIDFGSKNSVKNIYIKQPKLLSILNCLIGLLLPIPLRAAYCHNFIMKLKIKEMLAKGEFDLVYVKRLRMAQYAKVSHKLNITTVLDITDSLTKYYDRIRKVEHGLHKIIAIEEYYKHRVYERKICQSLYPVVICSSSDKEYLTSIDKTLSKKIHVLHNSIDVRTWKNENIIVREKNKRTRIVFFGIMDYAPNVLAVEYFINEVLPLLSSVYSLKIIGAKCDNLLHYQSDRIKFTGYVTDMKKALEGNDIFICPIVAGSGVKNKILQASMVGLPIVTTSLGIEGIDKRIKECVFLADSAQEMARSINQINTMSSPDLTSRIKMQQLIIENDNDNITVLSNFLKEIQSHE